MKVKTFLRTSSFLLLIFFLTKCTNETISGSADAVFSNGGYNSQYEWGNHLVMVGGCGDCHTPKKMGPMGPEDDSTLLLSGHPAKFPLPDIDRKMLESKGIAVTQTLTFWIGPWGVSYSANLTPDSTGLLSWTEEQFMNALKHGFSKGIKGNRLLLPPMPTQVTKHFKDEELKAMFAYLKTIKPIKNVVPQPQPPVNPPPPPPTVQQ